MSCGKVPHPGGRPKKVRVEQPEAVYSAWVRGRKRTYTKDEKAALLQFFGNTPEEAAAIMALPEEGE